MDSKEMAGILYAALKASNPAVHPLALVVSRDQCELRAYLAGLTSVGLAQYEVVLAWIEARPQRWWAN